MRDRRSQIVDAATAVMARQGFQQTSVDDVIREAGLCGKAHFYHYFKSKEELGYAVLRNQFERFAEGGFAVLRDPLLDPLERLAAFLDWVVDSYGGDCGCPGGTPCGALAAEMAEQHQGFRKHVDAIFERLTEQLQALLWEARPRLADDVDTERLARFIVATLEGALFMSRVKGDTSVLEGVASDLKRFVAFHERSAAGIRAAGAGSGHGGGSQ
jgi:TetR/AcrR family transcriptional repressor of nem operon